MAQHSHPPRRVAQSPKQNTFFGGAAEEGVLLRALRHAARGMAVLGHGKPPFCSGRARQAPPPLTLPKIRGRA